MLPRDHTPAEHALILLGLRAGLTCEQVNIALRENAERSGMDHRPLVENRYKMLHNAPYRPLFDQGPHREWEYVQHPWSWEVAKSKLEGSD